MPVQGPQWTEFLSCHVCFKVFDDKIHLPISLGCSHSVCKLCLLKLQQSRCPFDQSPITVDVNDLPVNNALLQLVGGSCHKKFDASVLGDNAKYYQSATKCIEDLALLLKPLLYDAISLKSEIDDESSKKTGGSQFSCILSRPMQRKLVTLINCQLLEEEGRARIMRVARSLGERTVTELILQHQNPQQLSANLWAAVRARGCQFLGPAMQEEVLSLILLALEDGSALSRKVLVLFVVQRLEPQYPHASKTAIGHVVQLLYRASCFKVTKREEESSLMQLKEEFRTHETLRREHDSQIVEIALEAGLRISPEQWSSLLYGDAHHKSHMQSIIDKLQTPQSFSQSVNELMIALERTGDPCNLQRLRPHLEFLSSVDPSPEMPAPSWENLEAVMKAVTTVVADLFDFLNSFSNRKHELHPLQNARYKTSMCRDLAQKGVCPRAASCTFAHSQEEIDKYRLRNKKIGSRNSATTTSAALSPKEKVELAKVNKTMDKKLNHNGLPNKSSDTEKPEEDTNTTEKNVPLESQKKTNDDLATSVEALTLQASTSTVSIVLSKAQKAESFVPPVQSHNRSVMSTTSKEPFVASNPPQPSCDVVQPPGGYQVYCPPLPPRPPPGPTYPYVAPDNTVYYSNPGYVNYDSQAVPPPSGQWSHPWYNHNQAVPYVPGVQSWDIGMYGPGWNQPGNVQQNSNQVRESIKELHTRRLEILSKIQQNSQLGCKQLPCELPVYQSKYPASYIPQNSTGPHGSTFQMQQPQLRQSMDVRCRPFNERSVVIIDHRPEQQKPMNSSLQERSFTHDVPSSRSFIGRPGLLHSTTLFTSVTDTVNVAKTSALEKSVRCQNHERDDQNTKQKWHDLIIGLKSGCAPYLTPSGTYIPWSSEECSTITEEDGGEQGDAKIQTSTFPCLKVHQINHQDGIDLQTEMINREYQELENFILSRPAVSHIGPLSHLSRTTKYKTSDPVHTTSDENMGKTAPVLSVEQPKTTPSPAASRLTIEEILARDMYPILPAQFSTDDIVLRRYAAMESKSEPRHTCKCCIPTSDNYLHEELAHLQNRVSNASNSDERLAYELQAIEYNISLGLPISVNVHENPNADPKKRLEHMDQQFSQQYVMDKIDSHVLGMIHPRNT